MNGSAGFPAPRGIMPRIHRCRDSLRPQPDRRRALRKGGAYVPAWTPVHGGGRRRRRRCLLVGRRRFDPATSIAAPPPRGAASGRVGPASEAASPTAAASVAPIAGGLLDKIKKAGKLVVSTDPNYPPQSELTPDGKYQGFDIDVATEIAKRLGVDIEFTTPDWTAITAGGWGGRWDVERRLDDDHRRSVEGARLQPARTTTPRPRWPPARRPGSPPSKGWPARPSARRGHDLRPVAQRHARLRHRRGPRSPPAGVKTTTLPTDTDCPDQWKAGRNDFEGWLSSITTVEGAIKAGLPLIKVGDPVYFEPLAVAVDKSGPDDTTSCRRSSRSSTTCTPTGS